MIEFAFVVQRHCCRSTTPRATRPWPAPRRATPSARTASSSTRSRRPSGSPTADNRITMIEIYQANPNGGMIGSPTVYTRTTARPTCTFTDVTGVTAPVRRGPRTGTRELDRCNILGGCAIGTRRSTTSASGSPTTTRWVTPLPNFIGGGAGGLTFERSQRHAHGADPVIRLRRRRATRDARGQGLVEFAMLVPLFMLLLLGLLEFGFVFDQTMTISYATREGARSGVGLRERQHHDASRAPTSTRTSSPPSSACSRQPGSRVDLARVSEIRIYAPRPTGRPPGTPTTTSGATTRRRPDRRWRGARLQLRLRDRGTPARATARGPTTSTPDSIGVSIQYNYPFVTPLGVALNFFGRAVAPAFPSRPHGHGTQPGD